MSLVRWTALPVVAGILISGQGLRADETLQGRQTRQDSQARAAAAFDVSVRLLDLDNHPVDPFQASADASAIVFVFLSVDCPVSNRYAPDIQKLHQTFGAKGVEFWLIYPNPHDSAAAIRSHLKTFGYAAHALRDPKHQLANLAKATITPEAAVYHKGALVYHGRIDDRYQSIGVERQVPTRYDLRDTLTAVLAGTPVPASSQPAVGCYIADFVE